MPPHLRTVLQRGPLSPVAGVSYRRVAFEEPDASLRVTIDRNIALFRPGPESASSTEVARLDLRILELKLEGEVPLWLQSALDERPPESISKFELAARALNLGA